MALGQSRAGGLGVLGETAAAGNLDNAVPCLLQLLEMRRLMGVAAHLQQLGLLVALFWLWSLAAQAQQVKPGSVAASGEAHQIRCGKKNSTFKVLHGVLLGLRGRRFRESPLRKLRAVPGGGTPAGDGNFGAGNAHVQPLPFVLIAGGKTKSSSSVASVATKHP